MEITPKQQRNMYAFFIGLFTINVGIALVSYYDSKRLQKMQKELTKLQLDKERKENYKEENN